MTQEEFEVWLEKSHNVIMMLAYAQAHLEYERKHYDKLSDLSFDTYAAAVLGRAIAYGLEDYPISRFTGKDELPVVVIKGRSVPISRDEFDHRALAYLWKVCMGEQKNG